MPPAPATLEQCRTALDLQALLDAHDWNRGPDLPLAIARHPQCDLAVALQLCWQSQALDDLQGEYDRLPWRTPQWEALWTEVIGGLGQGRYPRGPAAWRPPLSRGEIEALRQRGLDEVYLQVVRRAAAP